MAKQAHTDGSTGLTRVRMYRHGLGDCFLIRFPCIGPNRSYFCILVDCGLIPSSVHADTDRIMEAVVQDIGWTTDFHLDVVVVSSKRWDHVSGFDPDKGWFHGFRIDQVWLPWTVDPLDFEAPCARASATGSIVYTLAGSGGDAGAGPGGLSP